jgi:VanZ family protein
VRYCWACFPFDSVALIRPGYARGQSEMGRARGSETSRKTYMKRFIIAACRVAAWSLAAAIVVLSVVPPTYRPETPLPHDFEHFAIFAAAGWAFGIGYSTSRQWIMAGLVAFAAAVELLQKAVPGRHARLSDFIVDVAALLVAYLIGAAIGGRLIRMQEIGPL